VRPTPNPVPEPITFSTVVGHSIILDLPKGYIHSLPKHGVIKINGKILTIDDLPYRLE
jgi:hypothetical protein